MVRHPRRRFSPSRTCTVKFNLEQATNARKGGRNITLLFLQTHRVGGQRYAPAALPPEKTRCPLYRRLGGPQRRYGQTWKISPPTGIRSPDRPGCSQSLYQPVSPAASPNSSTCISAVQPSFLSENPHTASQLLPFPPCYVTIHHITRLHGAGITIRNKQLFHNQVLPAHNTLLQSTETKLKNHVTALTSKYGTKILVRYCCNYSVQSQKSANTCGNIFCAAAAASP